MDEDENETKPEPADGAPSGTVSASNETAETAVPDETKASVEPGRTDVASQPSPKSPRASGKPSAASAGKGKPARSPEKTPSVSNRRAKANKTKVEKMETLEKDDDDAASVGGDEEPPAKKVKVRDKIFLGKGGFAVIFGLFFLFLVRLSAASSPVRYRQ